MQWGAGELELKGKRVTFFGSNREKVTHGASMEWEK